MTLVLHNMNDPILARKAIGGWTTTACGLLITAILLVVIGAIDAKCKSVWWMTP
jgi:hypothetical protein